MELEIIKLKKVAKEQGVKLKNLTKEEKLAMLSTSVVDDEASSLTNAAGGCGSSLLE